ncbi:Sodium channel protein para [Orchesella cincta]|uniref:Sodium channel protein para n=1 Tax=Orchesella cincta TaxID=48709 RepID=A0A1D2MFM3_ORCCI|nr:Sodium channel protein para [Orchesella cincta]
MSTSAGWAEVLDGIINEDDCDDQSQNLGKAGDLEIPQWE